MDASEASRTACTEALYAPTSIGAGVERGVGQNSSLSTIFHVLVDVATPLLENEWVVQADMGEASRLSLKPLQTGQAISKENSRHNVPPRGMNLTTLCKTRKRRVRE
jgi:hypothetical protein